MLSTGQVMRSINGLMSSSLQLNAICIGAVDCCKQSATVQYTECVGSLQSPYFQQPIQYGCWCQETKHQRYGQTSDSYCHLLCTANCQCRISTYNWPTSRTMVDSVLSTFSQVSTPSLITWLAGMMPFLLTLTSSQQSSRLLTQASLITCYCNGSVHPTNWRWSTECKVVVNCYVYDGHWPVHQPAASVGPVYDSATSKFCQSDGWHAMQHPQWSNFVTRGHFVAQTDWSCLSHWQRLNSHTWMSSTRTLARRSSAHDVITVCWQERVNSIQNHQLEMHGGWRWLRLTSRLLWRLSSTHLSSSNVPLLLANPLQMEQPVVLTGNRLLWEDFRFHLIIVITNATICVNMCMPTVCEVVLK